MRKFIETLHKVAKILQYATVALELVNWVIEKLEAVERSENKKQKEEKVNETVG